MDSLQKSWQYWRPRSWIIRINHWNWLWNEIRNKWGTTLLTQVFWHVLYPYCILNPQMKHPTIAYFASWVWRIGGSGKSYQCTHSHSLAYFVSDGQQVLWNKYIDYNHICTIQHFHLRLKNQIEMWYIFCSSKSGQYKLFTAKGIARYNACFQSVLASFTSVL